MKLYSLDLPPLSIFSDIKRFCFDFLVVLIFDYITKLKLKFPKPERKKLTNCYIHFLQL